MRSFRRLWSLGVSGPFPPCLARRAADLTFPLGAERGQWPSASTDMISAWLRSAGSSAATRRAGTRSGNRYDVRDLADYYKAVQNAAIEQPLDAGDEVTVRIKVDLSVGNNLRNILSSHEGSRATH